MMKSDVRCRFAEMLQMAVFASAVALQMSVAASQVSGAGWDFSKGIPKDCVLRGSAALDGTGLVPKKLHSVGDCPSGAVVHGFAIPRGAFVFEAEFAPYLKWSDPKDRNVAERIAKSNIEEHLTRRHVLWDSIGAETCGFRIFCEEGWNKRWTPRMHIYVGERLVRLSGPTIAEPKPGGFLRLSVSFDGTGYASWNFAGLAEESFFDEIGGVRHSVNAQAVIGDNAAAPFLPANAVIRSVRIVPCPRRPFAVQAAGRTAFERWEGNAAVRLRGVASRPVARVDVSIRQLDGNGKSHISSTVRLDSITADSFADFEVPVETRLSCGKYGLETVSSVCWSDGGCSVFTQIVEMAVSPLFADRMPVVMWGVEGYDSEVARFGFTHKSDRDAWIASTDLSGTDEARRLVSKLDRAAAAGIRMMKHSHFLYPEGIGRDKYHRRTRDGKHLFAFPQPEVSNQDMVDFARKVASRENSIIAGHPAFAGVLPCSEVRDRTFPSFNTEHRRYEKETGREVPLEVKRPVLDFNIARKRFPDGVVPDDDPLLAYYRWFWRGGDGWPGYVSAIADSYTKNDGREWFSFWDPSVRCPPIWGSGGTVSALSQWVYAQPEPMNVAGPAEEVIAMADGRPGQIPMIMTQLICYRSQLAPAHIKVSPQPEWVRRIPNALLPAIPPDALQEALWSMISKPVKGIMFYGWGNIFDTASVKYAYTSPETGAMMRRLLNDVVLPLGPMLKHLGREKPPVAVLESFATVAFGGPGSWGWKSLPLTFLQRAGLDPRVVYEDTVARDGLGDVKVLYAPECTFLPSSTVKAIKAFQRGGGILVADRRLLPALKADVVVPVMAFVPPKLDNAADVGVQAGKIVKTSAQRHTIAQKQKMLADAESLRTTLRDRFAYRPKADRSSGEIAVYSRSWKGTPYLFAVNDRRTFGDYVGQWGVMMEKGMPLEGVVTFEDASKKIRAVYELSRGGEVRFSRDADSRISVPLKFDTNDGRLLMFLPRRIAHVGAWAARSGNRIKVKMTVKDAAGAPVQALLPVEIRVYDASGRELDGAGFACARNGVCELSVLTNINDAKGFYSIVCRDRASGIEKRLTVK